MDTILLIIIIITLYGQLGKRLGSSPIKWGFIGLGVFISIQLTGLIPVLISNNPGKGLVIWQAMYVVSSIGALGLAFFIAFRNKLIGHKR